MGRQIEKESGKTGFWWKVYLVYAFMLLFAAAIVFRMSRVVF